MRRCAARKAPPRRAYPVGSALAIEMLAYVGIAPCVGGIAHRLPRKAFLVALDLAPAATRASLAASAGLARWALARPPPHEPHAPPGYCAASHPGRAANRSTRKSTKALTFGGKWR